MEIKTIQRKTGKKLEKITFRKKRIDMKKKGKTRILRGKK